MSKPLIFTLSAAWDDEASVWTGHCDDIPAAANAATLDVVCEDFGDGARPVAGQSSRCRSCLGICADHGPSRSRGLMAPQFDRALRELLRAAGCTMVRQGKSRNLAQPDHAAKLSRSGGDCKSTYRECCFAPGRVAKGVLKPLPFLRQDHRRLLRRAPSARQRSAACLPSRALCGHTFFVCALPRRLCRLTQPLVRGFV